MENTLPEHPEILDGLFASANTPQKAVHRNMDGFLASVEKRAYLIAFSTVKDEQTALDIVQDSMFSMVKSYANNPAADWPPLFFRILNNQITDRHRKRGLGRLTQWFGSKQDDDAPEAVDQLESEDFCPETLASSLDLQTAVKSAMDTLSHQQQQALILRLWEGLSVKETATAMSISEGSVKTHLSRAVQAMRTQLEEHRSA